MAFKNSMMPAKMMDKAIQKRRYVVVAVVLVTAVAAVVTVAVQTFIWQ